MRSFLLISLILCVFALPFCLSADDGDAKEKRGKFGPKEAKKLLDAQEGLRAKVEEYVKLEEERLGDIKKLLKEGIDIDPPKDGFGNPVTIFRIVKHFVRSESFTKMRTTTDVDALFKNFSLPDYWDLEKAGMSVIKMADKKKLSPKELADGAPDSPLSYEECFHVGRMAYGLNDYYHAAIWMEETWKRMEGVEGLKVSDKLPVLDFWSYSLYQEGNLQRAWWMTKQILEMDPDNARFKDNIPYYETEMKEKKMKIPKSESDLPPIKYETLKDKKKKKEL